MFLAKKTCLRRIRTKIKAMQALQRRNAIVEEGFESWLSLLGKSGASFFGIAGLWLCLSISLVVYMVTRRWVVVVGGFAVVFVNKETIECVRVDRESSPSKAGNL